MADGTKKTITLEKVEPNPWNKPDTQKFYWTVTPQGFNSEPVKYIQDKEKGAPEPEVGKPFDATIFKNDRGGYTIYPTLARKGGFKGQPRDDKAIQSQWALGQSVAVAIALGKADDMEFIKSVGKDFFHAIQEVKES